MKISKNAVLLGTAMLFTISPAWAGFEWTPPPAPEKVMMVPAESAAPEATPVPVVESRVIKDKGNMAPVAVVQTAEPENQITKMPATMMEAPVVATVSPVTGVEIPVQQSTPEYEDVQGFGSDIPLVTAMSQIVPADFAYSVDDQSMLGQKVSWTGGQAWNKVLEDAVAPLGLEVVVVDETVWIREQSSAPAPKVIMEPKADVAAVPPAEPMHAMKAPSSMTPRPPMADDDNMPERIATAPQTRTAPQKPSPFGKMKPLENDQEASAYPRRNPIPMMMKAGDAEASSAPQPMTSVAAVPEAQSMDGARNAQQQAGTAFATVDNHRIPSYQPRRRAETVTAPAPSKLDPFEIKYWTAEKGASLRNVLTSWGQAAGTQIHWTSPYDYRLPFALKTHATFPDAVTKLLTFYEELEPRPVGRLHPNLPNGPSVLVIENYGTMVY